MAVLRRLLLGGLVLFVGGCFAEIDRSKITGSDATEAPPARTPAETTLPPSNGGENATPGQAPNDPSPGPPPAASIDPDLVGWWSFEDADLGVDRTGHGHHAELTDAVVRAGPSEKGRAVELLGGKAFYVKSLSGAAFPKIGTLSVWFTVSTETTFDLLGKPTPENALYVSYYGNATYGSLRVACNPPVCSFADQNMTSAQSWIHWTLVWDKKSFRMYRDGARIQTLIQDGDLPQLVQTFAIGGNGPGAIDEVRLYGRALSDQEVAAIP